MPHDRQPHPRVALAAEQRAAFALLFHDLTPDEQFRRVNRALDLLGDGTLQADGLFVLDGTGGLVGVLACTPTPGGGALLWPPVCAEGPEKLQREDALLQHAFTWLQRRGSVLCQSLLAPEESPLAESLLRNGCRHLTRLWYFQLDLATAHFSAETVGTLKHTTYDRVSKRLFHTTLLQTYEASLDCPELGNVRTIDQIITGHQSQGAHDPRDWWLFLEEGTPVGVVLLAKWPEEHFLEIAYLGVVPTCRGRGLGKRMLQQVLNHQRRQGWTHVTLSVDERNKPAWNLYRGLGFEPVDVREAYIAVWR